jgi:hypothetical protein
MSATRRTLRELEDAFKKEYVSDSMRERARKSLEATREVLYQEERAEQDAKSLFDLQEQQAARHGHLLGNS